MKHIPGPWTFKDQDGQWLACSESTDLKIAIINKRTTGYNNVALIISAPELLTALEAVYESYNKGHGLTDKSVNLVAAAIKKAKEK